MMSPVNATSFGLSCASIQSATGRNNLPEIAAFQHKSPNFCAEARLWFARCLRRGLQALTIRASNHHDVPMLIRDRKRGAPKLDGAASRQDGRPYERRDHVQRFS